MAKKIALGGLLAALAVVIMCFGGMIPVATFVCPVLCIFLCAVFFWTCGSRLAWAWYGAVTVLTLLLGPDKEAAAVFAVLGYYPILKLSFERTKIGLLLKLMLFNIVILALYCVMIYVLGLQQVVSDYRDLGYVGVAVLLVLGNITFFLVDRLLTVFSKKRIRHGK